MSERFPRLGRRGQRFIIVDFETTGLDTGECDIVEIGAIACDEYFRVLSAFERLVQPIDGHVQYDRVVEDGDEPLKVKETTWREDALGAHRVHGIAARDAATRGLFVGDAADAFQGWLREHGGKKPVMVSDNAQFEWQLMKRFWRIGQEWPFHHCCWDTSLLLEAAGVGDPVPAHRALADCGLLHAAILRALDRTRGLR